MPGHRAIVDDRGSRLVRRVATADGNEIDHLGEVDTE
jgi:hypothetical protein